MEETIDAAGISNTAEETVAPETTDADTTETVAEVQARLAKAEELARNYKVRAEKAEKEAKSVKVTDNNTEQQDHGGQLTSRDTIAIINAKVHEEDVDEVLDYARYKKVSVAEALKSSVLKATLTEKAELRATAQATSTGKTRSGIQKASGESLLDRAIRTGELPDSDDGLEALLEARSKKK